VAGNWIFTIEIIGFFVIYMVTQRANIMGKSSFFPHIAPGIAAESPQLRRVTEQRGLGAKSPVP
jgi:hypothetical protein